MIEVKSALTWVRPRSVESITASLTSMVEQLKNHATDKALQSSAYTDAINALSQKRMEADDERTKALATAEKIAGLLG